MLDFLKNLLGPNKKEVDCLNSSSTTPPSTPSINSPSVQLEPQYDTNAARDLLKKAAQMKKEKKYKEACETLKEAYAAQGSAYLMIEDRLRLPMYLQLAGDSDEGWRVLNELNINYVDVFSQTIIANQMRVFLQKENNHKEAILLGVWALCKEVEQDKNNILGCYDFADYIVKVDKEFDDKLGSHISFGKKEKVIAHSPNGNPITDVAYKMFLARLKHNSSQNGVKEKLEPLLKKAKAENTLDDLSRQLSKYLKSTEQYDISVIRELIANKIS